MITSSLFFFLFYWTVYSINLIPDVIFKPNGPNISLDIKKKQIWLIFWKWFINLMKISLLTHEFNFIFHSSVNTYFTFCQNIRLVISSNIHVNLKTYIAFYFRHLTNVGLSDAKYICKIFDYSFFTRWKRKINN